MGYDLFIALSSRLLLTYQNNFSDNFENKKILITYDDKSLDATKWDFVVSLGNPYFNKSRTSLGSLKAVYITVVKYKKALKKVKRIIHYNEVSVYYPTLEDVLCNYLFFYFKNTKNFFVVEEGTLNYYLHQSKDLSFKKKTLKKAIALISGLNYNPFYKGHTSGIDYEKVKNSFVMEPKLTYRSDKAIKSNIDSPKSPKLESTVLIIGQEPYKALLGEKKYNNIMAAFLNQVKYELEIIPTTKLYYKTHRYGPRSETLIKHQLKDFQLHYLDTEDSIEKMYFEKIKAKYIFTLDSSALLSIYFSCSDKTRKKLKLFSFTVNPKTRALFREISTDLKNGI